MGNHTHVTGTDDDERKRAGVPKPTVIVAEDHPAVGARLVELLKHHFSVVGPVASGEALVRLVDDLRPDAVISDVGLKGTDGITATIDIRCRHPRMPIVLMTAAYDPLLPSKALAAGASAFLFKTEVDRVVHLLLELLQLPLG